MLSLLFYVILIKLQYMDYELHRRPMIAAEARAEEHVNK
jgi:hypothetical protein